MKHWTKDKHTKKPEIMTLNVNNPPAVKEEDHILTCTNTCMYLGSKVTTDGGAETDIKQRLSKARAAFNNLQLFGDQVSTPLEQN